MGTDLLPHQVRLNDCTAAVTNDFIKGVIEVVWVNHIHTRASSRQAAPAVDDGRVNKGLTRVAS